MTVFQADLSQPEPARVAVGTSATVVIASKGYKQPIGKIRVVNITALPVAVTLDFFDGTTAVSLLTAKAVPANDAIEIYDEILQKNESLRATAASGSALIVHAIYSLGAQR